MFSRQNAIIYLETCIVLADRYKMNDSSWNWAVEGVVAFNIVDVFNFRALRCVSVNLLFESNEYYIWYK